MASQSNLLRYGFFKQYWNRNTTEKKSECRTTYNETGILQWNSKFVCSDLRNNSTKEKRRAENSHEIMKSWNLTNFLLPMRTKISFKSANKPKSVALFYGFLNRTKWARKFFGETLNFVFHVRFFLPLLISILRRWPFIHSIHVFKNLKRFAVLVRPSYRSSIQRNNKHQQNCIILSLFFWKTKYAQTNKKKHTKCKNVLKKATSFVCLYCAIKNTFRNIFYGLFIVHIPHGVHLFPHFFFSTHAMLLIHFDHLFHIFITNIPLFSASYTFDAMHVGARVGARHLFVCKCKNEKANDRIWSIKKVFLLYQLNF